MLPLPSVWYGFPNCQHQPGAVRSAYCLTQDTKSNILATYIDVRCYRQSLRTTAASRSGLWAGLNPVLFGSMLTPHLAALAWLFKSNREASEGCRVAVLGR